MAQADRAELGNASRGDFKRACTSGRDQTLTLRLGCNHGRNSSTGSPRFKPQFTTSSPGPLARMMSLSLLGASGESGS